MQKTFRMVIACGPVAELEKLKRWLYKGPSSAQVYSVECEPVQLQNFTNFQTF